MLALGKETGNIYGYSNKRKSYLTTKKGYYLTGFTTVIKQASKKDVNLATHYAKELISSFEKIDIRLLELSLKSEDNTISTNSHLYDVNIGVMKIGRIAILIQQLSRINFDITFMYEYRTNFFNYSKKAGLSRGNYKRLNKSKLHRTKMKKSLKNKKYRK